MIRPRIILAGIANGDKSLIELRAANGRRIDGWIAPKDSSPGDDVVVYIGGYGFFATGKIMSDATPRDDRANRNGASVGSLALIQPAIFLTTIRRHIPAFAWANYPRSITTPEASVRRE